MRIFLIILIFVFVNNFKLSAQLNSDSEIQGVVIEEALLKRLKKVKASKVISILDSTISIRNHSWIVSDFEYHLFSQPLNKSLLIKSRNALRNLVSDSIAKKTHIDSIELSCKKKELTKKYLNNLFEISSKDGWKKFYKKNKKSIGFIKLSSTQYYEGMAVIFASYNYGDLGASGDVYILENNNNQWTIISQFNVYQS